MEKTYHCGTITTKQIIKIERNARREEDLIDSNGWTALHKVHKSDKTYSRKDKHKNTISS
jgi:hypothetical protein